MSNETPLKFVQANAILSAEQAREFARTAFTYRSVYDYLLGEWHKRDEPVGTLPLGEACVRFLTNKLKNLLSFTDWVAAGEKGLAYCALTELVRNLSEARTAGAPLRPPALSSERVVFYKQYDAKVRLNMVTLPILGAVRTTRFNYFLGSIRAVSVEALAGSWVCKIYYRENAPASPALAGAL